LYTSHNDLDGLLIFAPIKQYLPKSRRSPLKVLVLPSTFN